MHPNAAGLGIKESNIPLLIDHANAILSNIEFGNETIEVCGINPPREALFEFAYANRIYGNGIPQATFAFENFGRINDFMYTVMGKNRDTLKIMLFGNITFIKFHAKEMIEKLEKSNGLNRKLVIIGRPQLNVWNGNVTLQIVIDNFDLEEISLI